MAVVCRSVARLQNEAPTVLFSPEVCMSLTVRSRYHVHRLDWGLLGAVVPKVGCAGKARARGTSRRGRRREGYEWSKGGNRAGPRDT